MKNTTKLLTGIAGVAALTLMIGCEDKPKNPPAAETPKPATSAAPAAAAAELELSDDDVPVPEDFIEEATKEIDDGNLNAKLDELEKEIGTE